MATIAQTLALRQMPATVVRRMGDRGPREGEGVNPGPPISAWMTS